MMLKFFPRIRQKLINEGNLKRYLFYAIGEILLVLIGILLALQINKWSQFRKDRIQEKVILVHVRQEMQANLIQLEEKIAFTETRIEKDSQLLLLNSISGVKIDQYRLFELLEAVMDPVTFDPSDGVINSIISSGKIDLIQNEELKFLLYSLDGKISDLHDIEDLINGFLDFTMSPYLRESFSYRQSFGPNLGNTKFDYETMKLLDDKVFENIMMDDWSMKLVLRAKQYNVKEVLEKIIETSAESEK